jgi:predicted peptidase
VGRDIERVRAGGLPRRIEAGGRLPFIIVAPQSPRPEWDVGALDALLDEIMARYRVDVDRVYLTGSSMGGYGTWALAAAHPERFAAMAPICGGGNPASADRLRGVPTWAFHGAEDRTVPPEESRKMVAALERAGGDVRLTIYPGVGHDAWTITYADSGLYAWFLAHRGGTGENEVKAETTATLAH